MVKPVTKVLYFFLFFLRPSSRNCGSLRLSLSVRTGTSWRYSLLASVPMHQTLRADQRCRVSPLPLFEIKKNQNRRQASRSHFNAPDILSAADWSTMGTCTTHHQERQTPLRWGPKRILGCRTSSCSQWQRDIKRLRSKRLVMFNSTPPPPSLLLLFSRRKKQQKKTSTPALPLIFSCSWLFVLRPRIIRLIYFPHLCK